MSGDRDGLFDSMAAASAAAADRKRAYEQDRRARAVFAEIERRVCELCDADGYRPNLMLCDHIDRSETVRRGMALVRDALKLAKLERQTNAEPEEPAS